MRDCYDVKIYLDPEEDLRVKWKIHRDTTKRGYTLKEVMAQIDRREVAEPGLHPSPAHLCRYRHPLPEAEGG